MAIQGAEAISEEIFEEKAPYRIPTAEDKTDASCARTGCHSATWLNPSWAIAGISTADWLSF